MISKLLGEQGMEIDYLFFLYVGLYTFTNSV